MKVGESSELMRLERARVGMTRVGMTRLEMTRLEMTRLEMLAVGIPKDVLIRLVLAPLQDRYQKRWRMH